MCPTTGEPIKPARLAAMLMKATATAATEAVRVNVGNTQNGEHHETAKKPAPHNQANIADQDCPGITLAARQTPVSTWPVTHDHLCWPVRSATWPETRTPARPQAKMSPDHINASACVLVGRVSFKKVSTAVGNHTAR